MTPSASKRLLLAFVLAALAGVGLHFLFEIFPNWFTALLSPVNESLWEHSKIIYWPYAAAMLAVTRGAPQGSRGGWLISLLLIIVAMLAAGYVFHIILYRNSLIFDVGLYVVLMAAGFWLPGRLAGFACKGAWRSIPAVFVLALGGALILFTFLPPDHILFADLSAVHTWYTIPY